MSNAFELAALALIPLFLAADFSFSARTFQRPRHWRLRAAVVTLGIVLWSTWFALSLGGLLQGVGVLDLSALGWWGALAGVAAYEFGAGWYRRDAPRDRIDASGLHWVHPGDAALATGLRVVVMYPLLGLSVEAGALGVLVLALNDLLRCATLRAPALEAAA